MNKYKLLAKNTLLVFGGGIGAKLITLFMMPLYTRWLSVDGYGEIDLITVYVTLLLSIVSCCIPEALFIFPSGESLNKQKQYFSSGVTFNFCTIILITIIFGGIVFLAEEYNWTGIFINNIWLIYIMLVSNIFQQQVQQFCRSTRHMVVYSLTGVIYTLSVFCLSFYFVTKFGVIGYIICISIANFVSGLYCLVFSHTYEYYRFSSIKLGVIREMLKYSVPLIPNSVMWWLVNAINRPIMEDKLGLYDIGIYAVANRFPGIISMIFAMFTASWQISAIEEFNDNNYSNFYNKIFRIIFTTLLVIFLIIVVSSKLLVGIFANNDFYEAWKYIPILTFGTFISCLSAFIGVNFSAARKSKYFLLSSIYGAITSIALNMFLIPLLNMWGACLAVVMSFLVITVSRIIFSERYVKIDNIYYYIISLCASIVVMVAYNYEYYFLTLILIIAIFSFIIKLNRRELSILLDKINSLISK